MIRATVKGLLARKLRLLLSGFAVVLGVMFASGSFVVTDTLARSFTALLGDAYAQADVVITGEATAVPNTGVVETAPVPERVRAEVAALPGVGQATGIVLLDGARAVNPRTDRVISTFSGNLGLNWYGEDGFTELRQGRGPASGGEVAINAALADLGGFQVGDRIDVLTREPRQTFTVVGVFGYRGGRDSLYGETGVAFTTPVAQRLLYGEPDVFTEIDIRGTGDVPAEVLRDGVAQHLGDRYPGDPYTVSTGAEAAAEQSDRLRDSLTAYGYVLLGFAGVALLVGALLVFNTFSIVVAQRRRELALLRALGATRRQAVGAVMVEALIIGLTSSAIGLGLGVLVGWLLTGLVGDTVGGLAAGGVAVSPAAVAASLVVGLLVTLVAALRPALRASRVSPLAALREASTGDRPVRRTALAGGAVTLAGLAALAPVVAGDPGGAGPWLLAAGVPLCFVGALVLSRAVARPVASAIGRLFAWSVPGELGRRNTAGNPGRTAVTAAALVVGVTLVTAVSVVLASSAATMRDDIGRNLRAQIIIAGSQSTVVPPSFDPAVLDGLRRLPEVAAAAGVWTDFVDVPGGGGVLYAVDDLAAWRDITGVAWTSGSPATLGSGQVIVDDRTAAAQGIEVGSRVGITLPRGDHRSYTVVGVYTRRPDVASGHVIAAVDAEMFRSPRPTRGLVRLHEGADPVAVRAEADRLLGSSPEVLVHDRSSYIAQQARTFEQTRSNLQVLLALALVIAVLGVVNTLVLSVIERTREIGVLRALGLSRAATVRMVTVESVVISLFGALSGIALGAGLGVAVVRGLRDDGITLLSLPWTQMVGYLVVALVVGVVAAVLPAIRASRVDVLAAIAHE
jgi:putative ABC transport system permease protein